MFCEACGCGGQPRAAPASRAQRRPVRCAHAPAPRALSRAPLPSPPRHRRSFPPWAVPCSGGWQPWDTQTQPDVVGVQASLVLGGRAPRAHAWRAVTRADLRALPFSPRHAPARPHLAATRAHGGPVVKAGPGASACLTEREPEAGAVCRTDFKLPGDYEHLAERSLAPPPRPSPANTSVRMGRRAHPAHRWRDAMASFRFPGSPILFLSQGPVQDPTCHAAAVSPSAPPGRDGF